MLRSVNAGTAEAVETAAHTLIDDGDSTMDVEGAGADNSEEVHANVPDMGLEIEEVDDEPTTKSDMELLHEQQQSLVAAKIMAAAASNESTLASNSLRAINVSGSGSQSHIGSSSGASAVYRWYDVEEGFNLKRREESSIAKCKLCREQGKLERKTCVRFSKSVTSNLWRHLKENHPAVYEKHAGEKKSIQMHRLMGTKKRGRKKKETTSQKSRTSVDEGGDKLLVNQEEDDDDHSDGATSLIRKLSKRPKRSDQFIQEYQQQANRQTTSNGDALAIGSSSSATGHFNPEKVREAMGYLCLYEMLPFELCSSHAFRNLMMECSGGSGGYVDESNSFAVFGKEIACGYAKKLAAEVKARVTMQMKMTDSSHIMVSEWKPSDSINEGDALVPTNNTRRPCQRFFVGIFAVGLDQEFNAYRRCIHVMPVEQRLDNSISSEVAYDSELKKAIERILPCKYMPQLIGVERPSNKFQSFCADNSLEFFESVPSLLQTIMISTINEENITQCFFMGSALVSDPNDLACVGVRERRLDKGEYIESITATPNDQPYEISETETATSILEELPTSLTGHTYRDMICKVMYFLAHLKQSEISRRVLLQIAVAELGMTKASYESIFCVSLRETVISITSIYDMLSLVFNMMPALKRYFALHKDGLSDFSKLIQLSSLSQYEWSRIAYLKTILKPFADAIGKLDAEKYVVSSLIIPSIYTLLEKLRDSGGAILHDETSVEIEKKSDVPSTGSIENLPEDIVALKDLAYSNLSATFGYLFVAPDAHWNFQKRQTFNLLWSATLLDPRTRPFIIKGPLTQAEFWEVVKIEAANIAGTKANDKENGNEIGENPIALEDENGNLEDVGADKTSDLWDDLQANLASCAQEEMVLSSSKTTLEMAKSSNLLEVEVSFFQEEGRISLRANPLEWWHNMRIKYPLLARLARYILSMPCNVKIHDNPVVLDNGLMKRAQCQMSCPDLCDLLAASMNLRTEKNTFFEASNKQMWSTV